MSMFYCPYFWDSPNLEGQIPAFISARNREAQLYPRALGGITNFQEENVKNRSTVSKSR
jgi:hypothetical protein